MPEEEKKEEGTSSPASEDQKPKEEPSKEDNSENTDHKAELEKIESERAKEKEEAAKLQERLGKAEFTIEKLKRKMKDEGIEPEEQQGGVTEEAVKDIITGILNERDEKQQEFFKTQIEEVFKGVAAKKDASKGAGAGQKQPIKKGPPTVSQEHYKIIKSGDLRWNQDLQDFVNAQHPSWKDLQPFVQ